MLTTAQLSEDQRRVAKHQKNPSKHLMVRSVPGSGKSSMLEFVIGQMSEVEKAHTKYIVYGKEPREAFNRRTNSDIAQTANSLGYQTLRRGVKPRDLKSWMNFTKYQDIAADLLDSGDFVCDKKDERKWIESADRLCGLVRNNLVEASDYAGIERTLDAHALEAPFKREESGPLIERMLKKGMRSADRQIDFIDQVWLPHVMEMQPERYARLLGDEVQDWSYAARSLIFKSGIDGAMTLVGDPMQAIYYWAGSPPNGMAEMQQETGADELGLDTCFRCPSSHVESVKPFAPQIRAAEGAKEGKIITLPIRELYQKFGWKSGDLFLCRVNEPLVKVALKLMWMGVPVMMRNRGFGFEMSELVDTVDKKTNGDFDRFCEVLNTHRRHRLELMARTNAGDQAIATFLDKCSSLEAVYKYCYENNHRSLSGMKQQIKKMFEAGANRVILSSIHSAKGDEAPRVFLVDPGKSTTGKGSDPESIQQEKNLVFISRTRCTQQSEGYLFNLVNTKCMVGEF